MLHQMDEHAAPWNIVRSNDKRRARLNLITHLLDQVPYKKIKVDLPKVPKAEPKPKGAKEGLPASHVVRAPY